MLKMKESRWQEVFCRLVLFRSRQIEWLDNFAKKSQIKEFKNIFRQKWVWVAAEHGKILSK